MGAPLCTPPLCVAGSESSARVSAAVEAERVRVREEGLGCSRGWGQEEAGLPQLKTTTATTTKNKTHDPEPGQQR